MKSLFYFIVFILVMIGVAFIFTSCKPSTKNTDDDMPVFVEKSNGDVLRNEIPMDGKAHVIYRTEDYVIMAKAITIDGSYRSHVVWRQSIRTDGSLGGTIDDLSTH